MPDTIKVGDKWYISASAARSDERAQVLKHNETFAVLDRFADMRSFSAGGFVSFTQKRNVNLPERTRLGPSKTTS